MTNSLLILARVFHLGSGLVLIGVVSFRWLILLPAFADESDATWRNFTPLCAQLNKLFIGSGVTLLVSGLLLFWSVSAAMSDASLIGSLDAESLGTVFFQTHFGRVFQWRLGGGAALTLLTWLLARRRWQMRRDRSLVELITALIATALMVSFAWTGHAAASGGPCAAWKIAADAFHLLVASLWPVGLLPFALFLACANRIEAPLSFPLVLNVVGRFSNVSLIIVGILIFTGLINAWFMLGGVSALFTTTYGQVLCIKLLLFGVILGIAADNRFRLLPRLADQAARHDQREGRLLLRRLRHSVTIELALAIGLIVDVGFLGTTPPPP